MGAMAFGHLEAAELIVLLLTTPFLFLGYLRTRRLQRYAENAGLKSLGRFFLLYGIASIIRFGFAVVALLTGRTGASLLADPAALPSGWPLALHFLVTHALLLAALGFVAAEYVRGSRGFAAGLFAVAAVSLPLIEAVLASVPAIMTLANQRGRHTKRSRHIAAGFSLLALGHLVLVPLAGALSFPDAFHFVVVSQLLALCGALTLVFALPRGAP